ncbi:hypothetical protein JCM6882_002379 [Rhodosporidiobolus microsporus]
MSTRTGIPHLLALRDELNTAIDGLVASSAPLPALDDLAAPVSAPSPAAMEVLAMAKEMTALLQGTAAAVDKAFSVHIPSCLRVAVEAHVVEALEAARKEGKTALHVDEIAKWSAINSAKLARVLRLLAANHFFVEIEPDTFALNRCALSLGTGKTVEELKNTKDIFSNTDGLAALVCHTADDVMKGAAHLADVLFDPSTANSYSPAECATPRAWGVDEPIWEYWARPGHEHMLSRFGTAMRGMVLMSGGNGALNGFPFQDLPDCALIVDVGGGVGTTLLDIAQVAPQARLILQDRKEVIEGEALKLWEKAAPGDLKSGRVQLMPHDFFTAQPVKGADVYFMRTVIHDWADDLSLQILNHLSAAAAPHSRLILCEQSYSYLPTLTTPKKRVVNPFPYSMDLQMLSAINAMERTKEQYAALGRKAGWVLRKVWETGEGGKDGLFRQYEFALAEK